jgi:hypothetical protein
VGGGGGVWGRVAAKQAALTGLSGGQVGGGDAELA